VSDRHHVGAEAASVAPIASSGLPVDPSGNTVAEDDDGASNLPGASAADPLVVARLPSTGTYTIVVSAAGGIGPYMLITMAAE
jgi:hypothetical protein